MIQRFVAVRYYRLYSKCTWLARYPKKKAEAMCGPEEGAADVVTHTEMTGTIASAEVDKPHVKPKSNNSNACACLFRIPSLYA